MRYVLNKEQFTGNYWIDGKKIYRTTIYVQNPSDGQTIATINNFDRLINQWGSIELNSDRQTFIPYAESGSYGLYIAIDNDGNVKCPYTGNAKFTELYLTIEYTKTTETGA